MGVASEANGASPESDEYRWKPVSRAEMARILDERAQRYLAMSGDEFLAALAAGELPDTAAVAHLTTLAGGPADR